MTQTVEKILKHLDQFEFTQNFEQDIALILRNFHKQRTFSHLQTVAKKALEIAEHYDADKDFVYKAAILHDISAIVPNGIRVEMAHALGVQEINKDDIDNPIMLHGKISAEIAKRYFGITNEKTLDAMRYHTTLRANASLVEQIVFIADKIALDLTETHDAEYLDSVLKVVNKDVMKACWYYLGWMFENLDVLGWQRHYDAVGAYDWLKLIYAEEME